MNRKVIAASITSTFALVLAITAFGHENQHSPATQPSQVTVQGELIDTACYVASDGEAKGADHAECAQKCLRTGIPAGILPEGSHHATEMRFLLTNPTVLAPFAAQTIKVEGTMHATMHAIDVKKLYVKDGAGWKEVQLHDEHHNMSGGHGDGGGHGAHGAHDAHGGAATQPAQGQGHHH